MWRGVEVRRLDGRKCYSVEDAETGRSSVHKFDTAKEAGKYADLLNRDESAKK
jgi:hypothetical protein